MIKNIYAGTRKLLPKGVRSRITQLIYNFNIKPSVSKSKSPLSKGVITFSADFEMAWAFRFSKTQIMNTAELAYQERENIPIFLNLFEKYNIPITWATVGHLFLDKCEKDIHGKAHSNMPRPSFFENRNWVYKSDDWYKNDPCSNVVKNPEWYASDLIESIINSSVTHEIACHTFSHIDCTYANCSKDLLDAELKMCKNLANEKNITLNSFVFPGGTLGNYEALSENQFICYRKPMKNHIDLPYIDKYGLVAIPSSLGLDKDQHGWSVDFHKKIIRSFIKKTIKSKQVCHFWFHPSMDKWYLKNIFPEVLNYVNEFQSNGELEVLTMEQLANKVLHNQ